MVFLWPFIRSIGAIVALVFTQPVFGNGIERYDVVIIGGTPGGIMTAVVVARGGHTAVLLDRNQHIGGLPANGLGATDIHTRNATKGLFLEFVQRIKRRVVNSWTGYMNGF